jgi:hypothetical protein
MFVRLEGGDDGMPDRQRNPQGRQPRDELRRRRGGDELDGPGGRVVEHSALQRVDVEPSTLPSCARVLS